MIEERPRITARRPGRLGRAPRLRRTGADQHARSCGSTARQGVGRGGGSSGSRRNAHLECDGIVFSGRFRPETAMLAPSHLEIDPGTRRPRRSTSTDAAPIHTTSPPAICCAVETAGPSWREGRRRPRTPSPRPARRAAAAASPSHPHRSRAARCATSIRSASIAPRPTADSLLFKVRVTQPTRGRLSVLAMAARCGAQDRRRCPSAASPGSVPCHRPDRACQQASPSTCNART